MMAIVPNSWAGKGEQGAAPHPHNA